MEMYEWLPTESALEKYPMRIMLGNFLCDADISVYIPPDRIVYQGLGETGSLHLTEEKSRPLPLEIYVAWFSYTENKFFEASFKLPVELLSDYFKTGAISPDNGAKIAYDRIIVGLWPEGNISLFVSAEGIAKEFYFNKGKEKNVSWRYFLDNTDITRSEYIESTLKEILPDGDIADIKLNGVPARLAEKYRNRYLWKTVFVTLATPVNLWQILFNGEHEFENLVPGNKDEIHNRPLPKKHTVKWTSQQQLKYISFIVYEEAEIFSAFDRLLNNQVTKELNLQIEINDAGKTVKVFITDDEQFIELKKCDIKVYAL